MVSPPTTDVDVVRFFRQTLGMDVAFDEAGTMELFVDNDDRIQVSGPGHHYFQVYQERDASIVSSSK